MDEPTVEIRRSARRRRTVTAYRSGDTVVVLMPAGLSAAQERVHVNTLLARLAKAPGTTTRSDESLAERADTLRLRYVAEAPQPSSIRFVHNQVRRWGSCTILDRSIRLTSRLSEMPGWVLDYVIVHELAHLVESEHSDRFHAIVARYPRTERAIGFLDGYDLGARAATASGPAEAVEPDGGDPTPPGDVD